MNLPRCNELHSLPARGVSRYLESMGSSHEEETLRQYIAEALLTEKRRSHRRRKKKHPGGPRTDIGALAQLDPGSFAVKVRGAMDDSGGSVAGAARKVGVAPRTMYHYLDDVPALSHVKTSSELSDKEKTLFAGGCRKRAEG